MPRVLRFLAAAVVLLGACRLAAAAELAIELGDGVRSYTAAELLARDDAQDIVVTDDVAYKREMRYRAVPVSALIEGVAPDAVLQAVALDGFAADLAAAPLLATDPAGARAWVAVEDPAAPWPPLSDAKPSAGPFYLVWTNPAAGGVLPEQWPYQMATLRAVAHAAERFPAMLPADDLPADSPVLRGLEVFRTNCMVCHTMNLQGDAQMGPDLNVPHNPTEYMNAGFLPLYIRDPHALRHWPQARMPGFSEAVLPDEDLKALMAYLGHMAGRKVQ